MHIEASLSLSRRPRGNPRELSVPPPCPSAVQSAQRRVVAVVAELLCLEHELHEISESLPVAVDHCAMEDESVAMDVPLWLRTTLQQVKGQPLQRVIEGLREAAQRTEDNQRHAFYEATRS